MGTQVDDFSPQLLEVVVDVSYLLLLSQVSSFELPQRAIDLHFEVGLQLLNVGNHCLLFAVQVSDCFLVFAFHHLDHVFGFTDHPIVLVIKLLHSKDVITPSLLCEL